jgi:hypothetical protein
MRAVVAVTASIGCSLMRKLTTEHDGDRYPSSSSSADWPAANKCRGFQEKYTRSASRPAEKVVNLLLERGDENL